MTNVKLISTQVSSNPSSRPTRLEERSPRLPSKLVLRSRQRVGTWSRVVSGCRMIEELFFAIAAIIRQALSF